MVAAGLFEAGLFEAMSTSADDVVRRVEETKPRVSAYKGVGRVAGLADEPVQVDACDAVIAVAMGQARPHPSDAMRT